MLDTNSHDDQNDKATGGGVSLTEQDLYFEATAWLALNYNLSHSLL